jgi:ABC-type transport system involved in multi-copper enzyme maturation permease subunit
MATARRSRFYLIRAFYAAVLFVILWGAYAAWASETGGELPSRMVSWFAFSTFCGITVGQEVLVILLTPALVAGVIADEKQRKTLHYLMASRLSSAEIVLGKLLVRMLYVIVLLGVSLPIMSLLVLFGGVDPRLVLLSCGATLSTAWFLATLSIWVSTIARRVREAFFIAFGLECLWLCSSLILRTISTPVWPGFEQSAHWLAHWIGASSPVEVLWQLTYLAVFSGGKASPEIELVAWMMGIQLACGLMLAFLAALQLRPIFRRQDGQSTKWAFWMLFRTCRSRVRRAITAAGKGWPIPASYDVPISRPRRYPWRRPTLGDHPMLWKELYTGRPRGFARLIGIVLSLIGGGFLAYYTFWLGSLAISEMWDYREALRSDYMAWTQRTSFMWFLYGVVPIMYILGIIDIAGSAAASMTSEHEEDTWVSLTSTDLTNREIVFAKILGALKRARKIAELIVFLIILGIIAGPITWFSIPLLIIAMVIYGCAAAALGVWISLHLRTTWRAQFLTMACLLLINVFGQGVLNMLSRFGYAPQLWPGFTPYEVSKLILDAQFIERLSTSDWPRSWRVTDMNDSPAWQTIFSGASLLAYASLAFLLTWHTLQRFEIVAGRARRPTTPLPFDLKDSKDQTACPASNQHQVADAIA